MTLLESIQQDSSPRYSMEQQASIAALVVLGYLDDEDNFNPDIFRELPPEALQAVSITSKRMLLIQPLIYKKTLLEGASGTGKSLAGVALMKMMKELMGMDIVVVGSRMDLNKHFGEHIYLDEKQFIDNLAKISDIGKDTTEDQIGDAIDLVLREQGVEISDSLLVFDEAYKLFDARTPSDKLVRVFGYFIAQARHYRSTVLLMAPDRRDLDMRIRRQINWFGQCSTRGYKTNVVLRDGRESYLLRIHGPNYWYMYDTHALVGFRTKHLDIKESQY
jgi:hypothetical protein